MAKKSIVKRILLILAGFIVVAGVGVYSYLKSTRPAVTLLINGNGMWSRC